MNGKELEESNLETCWQRMVGGSGVEGFGNSSQGDGGTLTMVLSAHGSRNRPHSFGVLHGSSCFWLHGLPASPCQEEEVVPLLIWREQKQVMKGELETKSREESLEEPEEGLSRLSLVLRGSLPSLSNEVSPPSTRGNNMAFHFYQLLSRLDLQNLDWNKGLISVFCSAICDKH